MISSLLLFKEQILGESTIQLLYIQGNSEVRLTRTSAPLVKVNSTYMKHNVGPRQPFCTS